MSKVHEILAQVRELELPERLELMDLLIQLDAAPEDDGYAEAWDGELQRRIDEIDSGVVTPIPCEEALRQISTLDS